MARKRGGPANFVGRAICPECGKLLSVHIPKLTEQFVMRQHSPCGKPAVSKEDLLDTLTFENLNHILVAAIENKDKFIFLPVDLFKKFMNRHYC